MKLLFAYIRSIKKLALSIQMKYSVSERRVKVLLWLVVVTNVFFSYTIFNFSSVLIFHRIDLGNLGLTNFLISLFVMFAPIFLLWSCYQTKKQNNNLFKLSLILSLALILIRAVSAISNFNLFGTIYILIYLDFAMFFKSKITKLNPESST